MREREYEHENECTQSGKSRKVIRKWVEGGQGTHKANLPRETCEKEPRGVFLPYLLSLGTVPPSDETSHNDRTEQPIKGLTAHRLLGFYNF